MRHTARLVSAVLGLRLIVAPAAFDPAALAQAGSHPNPDESARRALHDMAVELLASGRTPGDFVAARDAFSRLFGGADWRARLADDFARQTEADAKLGPAERGRVAQMTEHHLEAAQALREGRLGDAIERESEAIAACEQVLGSDDSRYWMFLQGLATIHRRRGDYRRAELCYSQALAHIDRGGGGDSMNRALIQGELAALYLEIGAFDRATSESALVGERWRRWSSDEFVRAAPGGLLHRQGDAL